MVTLALYHRACSVTAKWDRDRIPTALLGVPACVVGWEQGRGRCSLANSPLPTARLCRDAAPSPASGLSPLLCGLSSEEQHEKPDLYQRLSSFQ